MINLLPYDLKKQTRAARINTMLMRYIVISGFAVGFLVLACLTTNFFIPIIYPSNNNSLNTNQIKPNINSDVTSKVNTINAAKSILNQQVKYSVVLTKIASVLPAGTILDSLTLNDTSFTNGKPVSLKILASSSDLEATVKQNIQNTDLFQNPQYQQITENESKTSKYKYVINVSVTVNKGAVL